MATKGSVYKFERLAAFDGPGIRTVVFLKGCPLRCLWCSSPESWERTPELAWLNEKCIGCGICVDICPEAALRKENNSDIHINTETCKRCGACVAACPSSALKLIGSQMTVAEVMREVEKDEVFYHHSGGGVTLSGGEPLLQPEFCIEVLKASLFKGMSTAMETSGYAPWETLSPLLEYLDLIYIDIKHMEEKEHLRLTGRSNKLILENIKRVDALECGPTLIVRVPVIPGLNDTEPVIRKMVEFVQGLSRDTKIELLPYHRYGVSFYSALGKEYPLKDVETPSAEQMEAFREIVASSGVSVQIGG